MINPPNTLGTFAIRSMIAKHDGMMYGLGPSRDLVSLYQRVESLLQEIPTSDDFTSTDCHQMRLVAKGGCFNLIFCQEQRAMRRPLATTSVPKIDAYTENLHMAMF